MVTIDETTLGLTFAVIGVVFSVAWLVLALYGISTLRDLVGRLDDGGSGEDS